MSSQEERRLRRNASAMRSYFKNHEVNKAVRRDRIRKARQAGLKNNPAQQRAWRLKKYGLTVAQFDSMLASQNSRCRICENENPGGVNGWQVDHNHRTGETRGILCHHCNVGLGHFRDNPDLLRTAAAYLEKNV